MEKVDCLLDSSALVKRYHTEPGSDLIDYLFNNSPQAIRHVTDIQIVEVISIFYKLVRQGDLKKGQDLILRDTFLADIRDGRISIYEFSIEHAKSDEVYQAVSDIPLPRSKAKPGEKKERCGAIDMMTIMAMLEIHRSTPNSIYFCSDEHAFLVAQKLGLNVCNPEITKVRDIPRHIDRRFGHRKPKPVKVICKETGGVASLGTTQALDITTNGICLKRLPAFAIGKTIELKIGTHKTVDTYGSVRWVSEKCAGLQFNKALNIDHI